jgi:uncharacterized protein (TIGR02284 family)
MARITMMKSHDNDIKQLNSFLRGELSAVETYAQAIEKVDDPTALAVLRTNLESHDQRANSLRQFIKKLGGQPAEDSGVWGAFAQAVEGGAKMFGVSTAIAALEEGEDHGLADYRRDVPELTLETKRFVADQLLPLQVRTHNEMARLKAIH